MASELFGDSRFLGGFPVGLPRMPGLDFPCRVCLQPIHGTKKRPSVEVQLSLPQLHCFTGHEGRSVFQGPSEVRRGWQ